MANSFSTITDTIFARALDVLRNRHVAPQGLGMSYQDETAKPGDKIPVPVVGAGGTPRNYTYGFPTNARDVTVNTRDLTLSEHVETQQMLIKFKEMHEIANPRSTLMKLFDAEVASICDKVSEDVYEAMIFASYENYGTAGTSPFTKVEANGNPGGLKDATHAAAILDTNKAPAGERVIILDPTAMANARNQPALMEANKRGEAGTLQSNGGEVGTALGLRWYMDQQIPKHDQGSGTIRVNLSAGHDAGDKALTVDGGGTVNKGDLVTINSADYVATADKASAGTTLNIEPGLRADAADNATITVKADHTANFVAHREAVQFASRRLDPALAGLDMPGAGMESHFDQESGLALTMETLRGFGGVYIKFSILYGKLVTRPDLVVRLLG